MSLPSSRAHAARVTASDSNAADDLIDRHRTLHSSQRHRSKQSQMSASENSAGDQVTHWNQAKYWKFGKVVTTQNGHTGKVVFVGELPIAPGLWLGLELFHPHGQNYPMVDTEREGFSDKALIQRIISKKQLSKRKAQQLGQHLQNSAAQHHSSTNSSLSSLPSSTSSTSARTPALTLTRLERRALLKYVPCDPKHALFVLVDNVRRAVTKEEKVTSSMSYRRELEDHDLLPVKYMKLRADSKPLPSHSNSISRLRFGSENEDDGDMPEQRRLQMNASLLGQQLAQVAEKRTARAQAAADAMAREAEAARASKPRHHSHRHENDGDVSWDMTTATARLGRQLSVFGMDGQTDLLALLRRSKRDQKPGEVVPLPDMPRSLGLDSRHVILGHEAFEKSKARGLGKTGDSGTDDSAQKAWVDKRKARLEGEMEYNELDSESDDADEWKLQVAELAAKLGVAGSDWAEVDAITLSSPHRNVKSIVNLASYLTEHTTYAHVFRTPLAKLRALFRWVTEFVVWDVEEKTLQVTSHSPNGKRGSIGLRTRSSTFSSRATTPVSAHSASLADADEFAFQQNKMRIEAEQEYKRMKKIEEQRRNRTTRYVVGDTVQHELETERRQEEQESAKQDLVAKYASRKQHRTMKQEYSTEEKVKPNVVLLRRKGRSLGVAHLLCALCRKAGFCAVVVRGKLRLAGLTSASEQDHVESVRSLNSFPGSGDAEKGYSEYCVSDSNNRGWIVHYWVAVKLEEVKKDTNSALGKAGIVPQNRREAANRHVKKKERVVQTRWVQMDPFTAGGFFDTVHGLYCRRFVEGYFDTRESFAISHFALSIIPSVVTGSWETSEQYDAVCAGTDVEAWLNFGADEAHWSAQVLPTRYFSAYSLEVAPKTSQGDTMPRVPPSASSLHTNILRKSEFKHELRLLHGHKDLCFTAHIMYEPTIPKIASRPNSKQNVKKFKGGSSSGHTRFQQIYEARRKHVIASNEIDKKRVTFKQAASNSGAHQLQSASASGERPLDKFLFLGELSNLWRAFSGKSTDSRRQSMTSIECIFPHRGTYTVVVSCREWSDTEKPYLYDQVCTFDVVVRTGYFDVQINLLGNKTNLERSLQLRRVGYFQTCFPSDSAAGSGILRNIRWHEPHSGVLDMKQGAVHFVLSGSRDIENVVVACQGSFTVLARDIHDKQKDVKRKQYALEGKSILFESTANGVSLDSFNVYIWVQIRGEFYLYAVFLAPPLTKGKGRRVSESDLENSVQEYFAGDMGLVGFVNLKFADQWMLNRPKSIAGDVFPAVYNNAFDGNILLGPVALHMNLEILHADVFDSRIVLYLRSSPQVELFALLIPVWDSRLLECDYESSKGAKYDAGDVLQLDVCDVPIAAWKQPVFHPDLSKAERHVIEARERIVKESDDVENSFKFRYWQINRLFPPLLNKKRENVAKMRQSHKIEQYTLQVFAGVRGKPQPKFALMYQFLLSRKLNNTLL